ncbi:MAG: DUF4190 domain-containing protein [Nanoarchaeota archaeon]|nr:DUF4190 domain-containing protein [Nanoarchaeota archaeon]
MDDEAEKLYARERKKLDLKRNIETNTMWSFGLAVIGLFAIMGVIYIPLLIITGPLGIFFGFRGLHAIKKNKRYKGKGFAISGIIFGSLYVLFLLLFLIIRFNELF